LAEDDVVPLSFKGKVLQAFQNGIGRLRSQSKKEELVYLATRGCNRHRSERVMYLIQELGE